MRDGVTRSAHGFFAPLLPLALEACACRFGKVAGENHPFMIGNDVRANPLTHHATAMLERSINWGGATDAHNSNPRENAREEGHAQATLRGTA
jgi:hypothetical protein